MLGGLLHPHSSTPYVQMGRSIALYAVSLLSMDSCERVFSSQLMFLGLSCSWHRTCNVREKRGYRIVCFVKASYTSLEI